MLQQWNVNEKKQAWQFLQSYLWSIYKNMQTAELLY